MLVTNLTQITDFLDRELSIADFPDSSLNGLQFEGTQDVKVIGAAVDAGHSVFTAAAQAKVDFLIVHHGLFWETPFCITGEMKEKFSTLFRSNINLYAAHLPLDAHPQYGNNFSLARMLFLESLKPCFAYRSKNIGCMGNNDKKQTLQDMTKTLKQLPGANPQMLMLNFGPAVPEVVGILSGSGADVLATCKKQGIDTLITGEPRQFAYHVAKEQKLNAIFAGHYATETLGVQELAKAVAKNFDLKWLFLDEPTGI